MSSAENQRLVIEVVNPFCIVADFTLLDGHLPLDKIRIAVFNMKRPRTVTNLASCICKMGSLLKRNEPAGFPIPGSMTGKAIIKLVSIKI